MTDPRHEELRRRVERLGPAGVSVNVDHWYGHENDPDSECWGDPVYVIAVRIDGRETTAVADLNAATLEEQAKFVAAQLFE